jgi:hypothetical protein
VHGGPREHRVSQVQDGLEEAAAAAAESRCRQSRLRQSRHARAGHPRWDGMDGQVKDGLTAAERPSHASIPGHSLNEAFEVITNSGHQGRVEVITDSGRATV